MSTAFAPTSGVVPAPAHLAPAKVAIPQYGIRRILAVWAAAALPMGALAWLVAPALKDSFAGTGSVQMVKALIVCLTAGLIWQFVLVVALLSARAGHASLVDHARSALAPLAAEPAQRPRRRQDLADPRPADPRSRRRRRRSTS